jgi:serine/threonine protein kinase
MLRAQGVPPLLKRQSFQVPLHKQMHLQLPQQQQPQQMQHSQKLEMQMQRQQPHRMHPLKHAHQQTLRADEQTRQQQLSRPRQLGTNPGIDGVPAPPPPPPQPPPAKSLALPSSLASSSSPPQRLEDYVLDRVLGSGGSSTVVRASPVGDPAAAVALKAVAKSALGRRAQRYLAREIAVHRAIPRHPNIVNLHAVFENKAGVYLVMELLRGGDLYAAMRRERRGLEEPVALAVVAQVLDALAHIHALGISHRDVKLENIVLVRKTSLRHGIAPDDVHVKLVDFGLACARRPGAPSADRLSREKCGTLRYVAPEVFSDTPYAPERADLWSVGVVLYSIIAHRHPYAGNTGKDVLRMIDSTDLRLDTPAFSHISDDTVALIRALLDKDPEARPDALIALTETRRILASLPAAGVKAVKTGAVPSAPHAVSMDYGILGGGDFVASRTNQQSHHHIPGAAKTMSSSLCAARGEYSSMVMLGTGPPVPAPAPCTLDALSSAMSGDTTTRSHNRLAASPEVHSDPQSAAQFNLGDVVRGLLDVFNRSTSPPNNRGNAVDSVVLDQSDSDSDDTRHSSDLEHSTSERSVDDQLPTA